MIKEFKEFITKGDVLDLAVGVVIGTAFTSIVNQVVQGLITPLIGWIVATVTGTTDLEGALSILDWSPRKGVTFAFGDVVSAIITFLITGFVLFLVVKASNHAKSYRKEEVEEVGPTAEQYLSEIRDLLDKQVNGLDNSLPTADAKETEETTSEKS
ncbi:MAG: large conductance mechanosensitive channel protein MscL [Enterococcus sp.]